MTTILKTLLVAALLLVPTHAQSQGSKCLPRSVLVERLSNQYNESLVGGGLQSPQQLLEVWTNESSGTFTVFITRADGLSCILASGKYWSDHKKIPGIPS